jgi:hypothetical protein
LNIFDRLRPLSSNLQSVPNASNQSTNNRIDLIPYLIEQQQQFDGMWCFSSDLLNLLISTKIKSVFPLSCKYLITDNMFITALIIVAFEEQYSTERELWIPAVHKGKQRLLELLKSKDMNENNDRLEIVLAELREQISMHSH